MIYSLYRYALGQIPWPIYIQTPGDAQVVSQQLQRDHCQTGGKVLIRFGSVDDEIGGVLQRVVAVAGQAHQVSPTL